jgi:hypothetical protein
LTSLSRTSPFAVRTSPPGAAVLKVRRVALLTLTLIAVFTNASTSTYKPTRRTAASAIEFAPTVVGRRLLARTGNAYAQASPASRPWSKTPKPVSVCVPLMVCAQEPRVVRMEPWLLRRTPSAAQRDKPSAVAPASLAAKRPMSSIECNPPHVLNPTACKCECPVSCNPPYVLNTTTCTCQCGLSCNPPFVLNPNTCKCECPVSCNPPYVLNTTTCTCQCGLSCNSPFVLNPNTCKCECPGGTGKCDNICCSSPYTVCAAGQNYCCRENFTPCGGGCCPWYGPNCVNGLCCSNVSCISPHFDANARYPATCVCPNCPNPC